MPPLRRRRRDQLPDNVDHLDAITFTAIDAPAAGDAITLTARHRSGTAGTFRASHGVLLLEGEVTAARGATGLAQVWIDGVEVACYSEALGGTHPDGSRVALYVQYDVTLAASTAKAVTVVLAAPSVSALAEDTAARSLRPDVVGIPSATRACAAWPMYPLKPRGYVSADATFNTAVAALDDAFDAHATVVARGRTHVGWATTRADKYEGALASFHQGLRVGGADAAGWGHTLLDDGFRCASNVVAALEAASYAVNEFSEYHAAMYWAHAYWLTGNERYRTCAAGRAGTYYSAIFWWDLSNGHAGITDGRLRGLALMCHVVAMACEASYGGTTYDASNTTLRANIETCVGYQLAAQRGANASHDDADNTRDWTAAGPGYDVGGYWPYFDHTVNGVASDQEYTRWERITYMQGYQGQSLGIYGDWHGDRGLIDASRVTAIKAALSALSPYLQALWRPAIPFNAPHNGHQTSASFIYTVFRTGTIDASSANPSGTATDSNYVHLDFGSPWPFHAIGWHAARNADAATAATVRGWVGDVVQRFNLSGDGYPLIPVGLESDASTYASETEGDNNLFNAFWSQMPVAMAYLADA